MAYKDIQGLEKELLDLILKTCEREVEDAVEMQSNSPLIGPESVLGLDSLDAVEIVSLIQTHFGVRITSKETSVEVLNSLATIADYIRANR
jgi:acyl carrier protein